MKKRDYLVVETTSNDPAHIAQITRELKDAYANIRHPYDADLEEREERVNAAKDWGNIDIEVHEARTESNAIRYYLVIAPKGKAKQSLDDHKKRWKQ